MMNWYVNRNRLLSAITAIAFLAGAPGFGQATKRAGAGNKELLKGAVDSTSRLSGSWMSSPFGYEYVTSGGISTITKVANGSQAWARGLQVGDTLLAESTTGSSTSLAIDRGGKRYQINLSAAGFVPKAPISGGTPTLREQLAVLANHYVVLIIDKSGSMSARDCPGGLSRWDWCADQTHSLTSVLASCHCLSEGITIVLFSDKYSAFENATVQQLPEIFRLNQPDGTTATGDALRSQIDEYFRKKAANPGHMSPAVIAVITDGEPDRPEQVRQVIIDATRRMTDPNELAITFLQVGAARFGEELLHELDENLVNEGAAYDIVDTKNFNDLQKLGLIGAVAQAVTAMRSPSPLLRARASASSQPTRVQQPYKRTVNYARTVRQATQPIAPPAPAVVPIQDQLKRAEQERAEMERKLLEN